MLSQEESLEKLRQLLAPTLGAPLPKDSELTKDLLKSYYSDQEISLLANGIKKPMRPTTVRRIRKRNSLPMKEVKTSLKEMNRTGKIVKIGPICVIPPYLPGVFELYNMMSNDDPEKLKKAGEAHRKLFGTNFHSKYLGSVYPLLRVIPASEPVIKSIEVNKDIPVKNQVLTYETLKKIYAKHKIFAIVPCVCRASAKFSGNPCKRSTENFCTMTGVLAKQAIKKGGAKRATFDEVMTLMDRAEKAGLVHETNNNRKKSMYVCNCCPCCCPCLRTVHDLKDPSLTGRTNFDPVHDPSKCKLCETCVKKCPMEAITKQNNAIQFDKKICLGCGVCASNCPNGAITLKKTRNEKPVKGNIGIYGKLRKKQKFLGN